MKITRKKTRSCPVSRHLANSDSTLSSHALAALQQFYQESDEQQQRFEKLNELVARDDGVERITMNDFVEDWSTSQFWVGQG